MTTRTEAEPVVTRSDGDESIAHYANKADIVRAAVTGETIRALCGKVWTPTRDPSGLPVCERCVAERQRLSVRGLN